MQFIIRCISSISTESSIRLQAVAYLDGQPAMAPSRLKIRAKVLLPGNIEVHVSVLHKKSLSFW